MTCETIFNSKRLFVMLFRMCADSANSKNVHCTTAQNYGWALKLQYYILPQSCSHRQQCEYWMRCSNWATAISVAFALVRTTIPFHVQCLMFMPFGFPWTMQSACVNGLNAKIQIKKKWTEKRDFRFFSVGLYKFENCI